jgi:NADH:ubiquinone oxidoreductase subunit 6 (subunit J)
VGLVVFFLAGVGAIASALAIVFQRNPFVSALALLGNLASLAVLFLLLEADFVAAAQVIVYAGAITVMFLFVIAYVGPRGEVSRSGGGRIQLWAVAIAAGAILVEIAIAVGRATLDQPAGVEVGFGSPREIGRVFLTDYLVAFEVISILLLVAAVAGVVLGSGPRPKRRRGADGGVGDSGPDNVRRSATAAIIAQASSEPRRSTEAGSTEAVR